MWKDEWKVIWSSKRSTRSPWLVFSLINEAPFLARAFSSIFTLNSGYIRVQSIWCFNHYHMIKFPVFLFVLDLGKISNLHSFYRPFLVKKVSIEAWFKKLLIKLLIKAPLVFRLAVKTVSKVLAVSKVCLLILFYFNPDVWFDSLKILYGIFALSFSQRWLSKNGKGK